MSTRLERIKEAIAEAAGEGTPAIHWLYGRGGAIQLPLGKASDMVDFVGPYLPHRQIAYDLSPLSAQKFANILVAPHTEKHHLAKTSDEERRVTWKNVYGSYHNHWWVPTTINGVYLHWAQYGESAGGTSACFVTIGLPPGEVEDAHAAFAALTQRITECQGPLPERPYEVQPADVEGGLIQRAHRILEKTKRLDQRQQTRLGTELAARQTQLEEIEYEFLTQRGLPFYIQADRHGEIPVAFSRVLELAHEYGWDLKLVQQTICRAVGIIVATLEAAAHDRDLYRHHRPYYQQQAQNALQGITAADCGESLSSRLAAAEKKLRRRYRLLPFSLPLRILSALRDSVPW